MLPIWNVNLMGSTCCILAGTENMEKVMVRCGLFILYLILRACSNSLKLFVSNGLKLVEEKQYLPAHMPVYSNRRF